MRNSISVKVLKELVTCVLILTLTALIAYLYIYWTKREDVKVDRVERIWIDSSLSVHKITPIDSPLIKSKSVDKAVALLGADSLFIERDSTSWSFAIGLAGQIRKRVELPQGEVISHKAYPLVYDGQFVATTSYISYTFYHLPFIYVFNRNGDLVRVVETIEKVPFPNVQHSKGRYYFERGKAFNSNNASFAVGESLYVVSNRVSESGYLVLDRYDVPSGKYQGSFRLSSPAPNSHIMSVSLQGAYIGLNTLEETLWLKS